MIFYKIIGLGILSLSGVIGAHVFNKALSETKEQVDALSELVRYVRWQIECFSMPISSIFARVERDLLLRCGYKKDIPAKNFKSFLEDIKISDSATESALVELSQSFGNCYKEEQLRACERCSAALEERCAELSDEIPKRKKINTTLFISGALGVAIILI